MDHNIPNNQANEQVQFIEEPFENEVSNKAELEQVSTDELLFKDNGTGRCLGDFIQTQKGSSTGSSW